MSIIVPNHGPQPCPVLFLGEAPGEKEAQKGIPFAGPTGREISDYLRPHNLTHKYWRRANVVQQYIEGNPDPTPELLAKWMPVLEDEIRQTQPKLIIAAGNFAARALLGDTPKTKRMRAIHGIPHQPGCFDSSIAHRAQGAVVLPMYHPASGLHLYNNRSSIAWDFEQAVALIKRIGDNHFLSTQVEQVLEYMSPTDVLASKEDYRDATGEDLITYVGCADSFLGIDCEGSPTNPWSIQVSNSQGSGRLLRCTQPDFQTGITAIQHAVNRGVLIILHNAITPTRAMYDITMARAMGLDLTRANIFDTMWAAFLLRREPWGLSDLSWRHCGMMSEDYETVLAQHGQSKQITYLKQVVALDPSRPDKILVRLNNGLPKYYQPMRLKVTANRILKDIKAQKLDKDGNLPDPFERWHRCSADSWEKQEYLQRIVKDYELTHGPMPEATFNDVPLDKAMYYSCRDADAPVRLYPILQQKLIDAGVDHLMAPGISILKILEQYTHNGMPASLPYFEQLADRFKGEMHQIQDTLRTYLSTVEIGQIINSRRHPTMERLVDAISATIDKSTTTGYNPNSSPDTRKLLDACNINLDDNKKTKGGDISTAKGVIEKYRYTHPPIDLNFQYRERSKRRSTYCLPVIEDLRSNWSGERWAAHGIGIVHKPINMKTGTRRFAGDLLTLPVRQSHGAEEGFGRLIRDGYIAPPGYKLAAWDYSGWELRVFAHLTQDPLLLKVFHEGGDLHAETAYRLFGVPPEQQQPALHRIPGKTLNFAQIYGAYGKTLHAQFEQNGLRGWTVQQLNEMSDAWWEDIYTTALQWRLEVEEELRRLAATGDPWRDLFGMPRWLPGILSSDKYVQSETVRKAVSHVSQGTAQGALQCAMIHLAPQIELLNNSGYEIHPCLQMHDELDFWYRDDPGAFEVLDATVKDSMVNHSGLEQFGFSVPIVVEGNTSQTFGGLK